jgi:hypothetical protein
VFSFFNTLEALENNMRIRDIPTIHKFAIQGIEEMMKVLSFQIVSVNVKGE